MTPAQLARLATGRAVSTVGCAQKGLTSPKSARRLTSNAKKDTAPSGGPPTASPFRSVSRAPKEWNAIGWAAQSVMLAVSATTKILSASSHAESALRVWICALACMRLCGMPLTSSLYALLVLCNLHWGGIVGCRMLCWRRHNEYAGVFLSP